MKIEKKMLILFISGVQIILNRQRNKKKSSRLDNNHNHLQKNQLYLRINFLETLKEKTYKCKIFYKLF